MALMGVLLIWDGVMSNPRGGFGKMTFAGCCYCCCENVCWNYWA
jgi:hypothetical protein